MDNKRHLSFKKKNNKINPRTEYDKNRERKLL